MRKSFLRVVSLILVVAVGFVSCEEKEKEELFQRDSSDNVVEATSENGAIIEDAYIVGFDKNDKSFTGLENLKSYDERQAFVKEQVNNYLSQKSLSGVTAKRYYSNSIIGFSATMTKDQANELRKDPSVIVEPDRVVMLRPPWENDGGDDDGGGDATQEVPYGIARVNGGVDGTGKTAWILDTGVDFDHEDLNVDVNRSETFADRTKDADDQNGHGTHVAGTIAALDNGLGVIGVAAGASVVSVRVLDRRGSGSYSGVIAGVDYVGANGNSGDVANMSLGGPVSDLLDQAVLDASNNSGVKFVLAAGNESDDANNSSPARVNGPNVYTISAMDINDDWAYFSNYANPPVDFCSPGVNVKSTWYKNGYNTISGTSMAAPHAAGVLLLGNYTTDGTVNGDPDGNADPIIVH